MSNKQVGFNLGENVAKIEKKPTSWNVRTYSGSILETSQKPRSASLPNPPKEEKEEDVPFPSEPSKKYIPSTF